MSERLQSLLGEIQNLEKSVEDELHRVQKKAAFQMRAGKVVFAKDILKFHRSFREGIIRYIFKSNFLFVMTSPVIYSMLIPAFVVDIFCVVYQAICFPVYEIPKVKRSDYIRFDRHKLAYLNGVEKVNCNFCAYFNGTIAFAREVAARTEQYWCPVRHAIAVKGAHKRYSKFVEFGDAETYRKKLEQLRKELQTEIEPA